MLFNLYKANSHVNMWVNVHFISKGMKLTYSCCLYFLPQIVGTIDVTSPDLEGGSMCAEIFKKLKVSPPTCRRHRGPTASALDSGPRGPGSNPGRATVLCSWAKTANPRSTSLLPRV